MKITVESGGGQRLDRYLVFRYPRLSRALIMKYLKEGRARINGRRARPGLHVQNGDDIDLPDWEDAIERIRGGVAADLPREAQARRGRPEGVAVIYDDVDMVVVDKPPGLVMHPGEGHEEEGLDLLLRDRFGPSTRLVHRLDRDTSGVVVAARGHPKSARRLADAFKAGDVEKVYFALVRGVPDPPAGVVDAPLLNTRRMGESVRVDPNGSPAVTAYETVEAFEGYAWLKVTPRTGRRHQIRVHLAHIGHPLAVDRVYARQRKLRLSDVRPDLPRTWKNPVLLARQPLHAGEIRLRHPRTGDDARFVAPIPDDLEQVLDLLRARRGQNGTCGQAAERPDP